MASEASLEPSEALALLEHLPTNGIKKLMGCLLLRGLKNPRKSLTYHWPGSDTLRIERWIAILSLRERIRSQFVDLVGGLEKEALCAFRLTKKFVEADSSWQEWSSCGPCGGSGERQEIKKRKSSRVSLAGI